MSIGMSPLGATGSSSGQKMTGNIIPKGYKAGQLRQFNPQQMQLFQQLFGQVGPGSFLGKLAGGDQGAFEQMEAPAMRQFQDLQGQTASRFSGMGMGARRSSGFQNTMNQATSDFAQDLQARRTGLQRQALMDMMGISQSLLQQRPYEQFLTKTQMPFWKQLALGINETGKEFAGTAAKYAMGGGA